MQTTTATPAEATKAIGALRKRLSRWELDHLRQHCADLAQRLDDALSRIDTLESEVSRAWDAADSWRDQTHELVNDLHEAGKTVGLTMGGELVVLAETLQGGAA
jgi:phosphoserine phosphatase